ncbi:HD domain-containing protein [Kocuria marina]|uniref:HD domain-containing protein n=1 Tax=Kocuria marina TaxID=223184 RepID=UPI00345F30C2
MDDANPDATVQAKAEEHLKSRLNRAIYNHSQRVRHLALALGCDYPALDTDALVIAALFHDAGTSALYNGPDRFEVEGAHAAARFLERHGWSQVRIKPVWDAIALHTSPGIAENAGRLPALIRNAVRIDFGATDPALLGGRDLIARTEREFPRERIEVVLADAVTMQVERAHDKVRKAPAPSWPAHLMAGRIHRDPISGLNPNF